MKIVSGVIDGPWIITLGGAAGVGKTTAAAQLPGALFVSTERGDNALDVDRAHTDSGAPLSSAQDVRDVLSALERGDAPDVKTIVIDTVDWLVHWIDFEVAKSRDAEFCDDLEWGRGHGAMEAAFKALLDRLSKLQKKRGINVLFLAHLRLEKYHPPGQEAFERLAPKTPPRISALLRERSDAVLTAEIPMTVVMGKKGQKNSVRLGEERTLYTVESPERQAKNRWNLPAKMPFTRDALLRVLELRAAFLRPDPEPLIAKLPVDKQAGAREWFAGQRDKHRAMAVLEEKTK